MVHEHSDIDPMSGDCRACGATLMDRFWRNKECATMAKKDYWLKAWNYTDDEGRPILIIDRAVDRRELDKLSGHFQATSISLMRAISRETIDEALLKQD
jgi:hypothetical protein